MHRSALAGTQALLAGSHGRPGKISGWDAKVKRKQWKPTIKQYWWGGREGVDGDIWEDGRRDPTKVFFFL